MPSLSRIADCVSVQIRNFLLVLCIGFILCIFAWIFHVNFFFSDMYDLLAIKDIDEPMFQANLELMRNLAQEGRWLQFFSITKSAYGNLYWVLIYLLTLPFAQPNFEEYMMVIPRQVTLVVYGLIFYVFYKIGRALNYKRASIIFIIALICTSMSLYDVMTQFQVDGLVALFFLLAIFFLVSEQKKYTLFLANVSMAVALGLKLSALFMLPLFYFIYCYEFYLKHKVIDLKRYALHLKDSVFTIIPISVLVFCPTTIWLYFFPVKFDNPWRNLYGQMFMRFNTKWPPPVPLLENIRINFIGVYYAIPVLLFALAGWFWLIQKRKEKRAQMVLLTSLASMVCLVVLAFFNPQEGYSFQFYLFPLFLVFNLLYLEIFSRIKYYFLIPPLLIVLNIYCHREKYVGALMAQYNSSHSPATKIAVEKYYEYKKLDLVKPGEIIWIDFLSIFPIGLVKNYKHVEYFFDDSNEMVPYFNVFVISKKSHQWNSDCKQLVLEVGIAPGDCVTLKNIIAGVGDSSIVFEDEYIRVIRQAHP